MKLKCRMREIYEKYSTTGIVNTMLSKQAINIINYMSKRNKTRRICLSGT